MAARRCGLLALALVFAPSAHAQQTGQTLTLEAAETAALHNQPRILAAELRSRAAQQRIAESRAGYFPTASFNATGVRVADPGTATAAGALTTSSISDRFAYGGSIAQLITDFGRTAALTQSARYRLDSQRDMATLTGAQVRLAVRQAYYSVLGAEAVLHTAKDALANRHLVTHQLTELANNELRSTLDVSFAQTLESQAELAVVRAQSLVEQQRSRLAVAMGEPQSVAAPLADIALPTDAPTDAAALEAQAQKTRADLDAARLDQRSAAETAKAEQRLRLPTLQVMGAAGQTPFHDRTLQDNYAAAGFNLNIPIFNGGLFRAREAEAAFEAKARTQDVAELSLRVNQQVRDARSMADEALHACEVTQRLVAQTTQALHLAQARYDNGLGSIVELNEAQVNETSAEIDAADARYTYLSRRADLDYVTGTLN
ncbi:outer membrane protein [Granulicella rosea]|uniref:Outer membrane protein n=1 Tax=Granulicella rosea TaxID=474952 RepID=A0A239M3P7_9BACT|nr:TolC family protein [Granulicella rosea]SNT36872.1 outer membrane protein [Granulicella rosea]